MAANLSRSGELESGLHSHTALITKSHLKRISPLNGFCKISPFYSAGLGENGGSDYHQILLISISLLSRVGSNRFVGHVTSQMTNWDEPPFYQFMPTSSC